MSEGHAGTPTVAPPKVNETWIRERWLPALRSGTYKQGMGHLRTSDDRYCCLGVACDLLIEDGVLPSWSLSASGHAYVVDETSATLPDHAVEFLGLPEYGLDIRVGDVPYDSPATANDEGVSFSEIADGIEDWLDHLSAGHAS